MTTDPFERSLRAAARRPLPTEDEEEEMRGTAKAKGANPASLDARIRKAAQAGQMSAQTALRRGLPDKEEDDDDE